MGGRGRKSEEERDGGRGDREARRRERMDEDGLSVGRNEGIEKYEKNGVESKYGGREDDKERRETKKGVNKDEGRRRKKAYSNIVGERSLGMEHGRKHVIESTGIKSIIGDRNLRYLSEFCPSHS